jgi:hypothetical protein
MHSTMMVIASTKTKANSQSTVILLNGRAGIGREYSRTVPMYRSSLIEFSIKN